MQKFRALGAPPPDPQPPAAGPTTAPPIANFWRRAWALTRNQAYRKQKKNANYATIQARVRFPAPQLCNHSRVFRSISKPFYLPNELSVQIRKKTSIFQMGQQTANAKSLRR